jgi:hypothetical protein
LYIIDIDEWVENYLTYLLNVPGSPQAARRQTLARVSAFIIDKIYFFFDFVLNTQTKNRLPDEQPPVFITLAQVLV